MRGRVGLAQAETQGIVPACRAEAGEPAHGAVSEPICPGLSREFVRTARPWERSYRRDLQLDVRDQGDGGGTTPFAGPEPRRGAGPAGG